MARNSSSPRKSDRLNCLMPRFLPHPSVFTLMLSSSLFFTSFAPFPHSVCLPFPLFVRRHQSNNKIPSLAHSRALFFPPSLTRSRSLTLSLVIPPFSSFFPFFLFHFFLFLFLLFWANRGTTHTRSHHPTFLLPALLPALLPRSSSLRSSCPTPYQLPPPRNLGSSGNLADKKMGGGGRRTGGREEAQEERTLLLSPPSLLSCFPHPNFSRAVHPSSKTKDGAG